MAAKNPSFAAVCANVRKELILLKNNLLLA
jgi:hypothetical protein